MTTGSLLGMVREAAPAAESAPPAAARMYDYYLGGKDNYEADRELAERALRAAPVITRMVQVNRAYLHHSARFLAEQAGLRQFLDIGCGLPSYENLHGVVRRADPSCRVAYLDNDPMVLSHARALLAGGGHVGAFEGDLRDPAGILGNPELRQLIDFSEPVGVFLLSVLHYLTDADDPAGVVAELVAGLPPGSHLVISHAELTPELGAVSDLYQEADVPFTPRTREAIAALSRSVRPVPARPADLLFPHSGRDRRVSGAVPLIGCIGRKYM